MGVIKGLLELWPVPTVRDGRAVSWHTDEEFARQVGAALVPRGCQPDPHSFGEAMRYDVRLHRRCSYQ